MDIVSWNGLRYMPRVLSEEEQRDVLALLKELPYEHQNYGAPSKERGYQGPGQLLKRGYLQFGVAYKHTGELREDAPAIPLLLRKIMDAQLHLLPNGWAYNQCVVMHYPAGTHLGWHIDGKRFGEWIAGFSFGTPTKMEFRRSSEEEAEFVATLDPGSLYVLSAEARWKYGHQIERLEGERFSLTYRCSETDVPEGVARKAS